MKTSNVTASHLPELLPGIDWITDPQRIGRLSQDFSWFSPVLKRQLADKSADMAVRPRTEDEIRSVVSACATHGIPITVRGSGNAVQHEASVSQISAEQIFYMQQRGLTEGQAMSLSVNGFVNDLVRQFPMEYSVELKRLIDMEMEGSVG